MPAVARTNWCGLVEARPARVESPASVEELARVVRAAASSGGPLRVVGSAHSFTPLIETPGTLVSLDGLSGIESVDRSARRATVLAGTKLHRLNPLLEAEGLAMENLGDINVQSIAGAVSTGTHGTGINYGSISTQAVGLTLVIAAGEILECSEEKDREIFKAAQVSLGALGVLAKIRLRLEPSYNLRYERRRAEFAELRENLMKWRNSTRHFEFYFFPHTETVQLKFLNATPEPAREHPARKFVSDVLLENAAFGLLSRYCRLRPSACASVSRLCAKLVSESVEVSRSHRVFSTSRMVRFYEMEYSVPAERGLEALTEIKEWIAAKNIEVHFPIEFRFVKGDDIPLSPAHGRDSAFIAVHMYRGMKYLDYFAGVEAIFRNHGGRPHWGKLHTQTAATLRPLYPRWEEFHSIRRRLDPKGLFMNDHLRRIFEQ